MVGGEKVRPKSEGAERWASQRNGVQGDWGVPKARDAPATKKSSSMDTKSLLREKSSNMEVRCEGVEGATAKPPPRLRRGEPPAFGKEPLWSARPAVRSRPSGATQHRWGKSGLGALLRERKVTGRDASLPAPFWLFPWNWSPAEQLGRCPKPHKGAPPLDPARGIPP